MRSLRLKYHIDKNTLNTSIDRDYQQRREQYVNHPNFKLLCYSDQVLYLYLMVHDYVQLFITDPTFRNGITPDIFMNRVIDFYDLYTRYDDDDIFLLYESTLSCMMKYPKKELREFRKKLKEMYEVDKYTNREEKHIKIMIFIHTFLDKILNTFNLSNRFFKKCVKYLYNIELFQYPKANKP